MRPMPDLKRFAKALRKPRTMEQLVDRFDVDRRTVYRWMRELEGEGCLVVRVGLGRPTKYQIAA